MARLSGKSLLRKLAEAQAEVEAATERFEELKAIAREQLPMGKTSEQTDTATVVVELQPNRRWNKDKARESFGDDICSLQVDQKLAQRKMTGEEYESFYVEGAPKVIVKVV